MNLGDKVFYLEPKTKKKCTGELVGLNISDKGYVLCSILPKSEVIESVRQLEDAHVFSSQEELDSHCERVIPIVTRADKEIKDVTELVDELRVEVIGEPEFPDLAERVVGS